jgi:adenosylmethionine-8-amino-7-oxononanoate aminotransferase
VEFAMALEKELETYKNKLPELKANEGKFVLIKGDQIVDTYSSYEDAIKEGYAKFKLEEFLVKQIHSMEQVQFISRFVDPCAVKRAS